VFSGHVAEGYRGDPYPNGSNIDPRGLSFDAAVEDLKIDFRKRRVSPWRDPEIGRWVEDRWDSVVETHRAEVATGTDLLDVFYIYEYYRRVAAHGQDNPWTLRVAPFANPKALMAFFRFPSPRGRGCLVHRTILKRYLGKSYYRVPINLEELAPFLGGGRVRLVGRRVTRDVLNLLARRKPGKPFEGPDRTTGGMFAGPMRPMLRDLLGRENGLCATLLRSDALDFLFDTLAENTSWSIDQIGLLVTMEHWLEQLNALKRFAGDTLRPTRSPVDLEKR